jgi:WD40 repeat protein
MLKTKLVSRTMPLLIALFALIACNTTNDSKPIQPNAVSELQLKWTGSSTSVVATWGAIYDIAWKPDGTKIAVGDRDNTYITTQDDPTFQSIPNLGSGIAWQKDGQQIVGNDRSQFLIVNPDTGSQFTIQHGGWFGENHPITWSPDGRYIVGIQPEYLSSGRLIVIDTTTRQVVQNLGSQNQIFALNFNSSGTRFLVVGSGRGLYDTTTFEKIFSFPNDEVPRTGDFSPNGNQYAIAYFKELDNGDVSYRIGIHNTQTGIIEQSIALSKLPTILKWNSDGTQLGGGFSDGTVSLWNVSTGLVMQNLPTLNSGITDLEWHPSGSPIAVAGYSTLVFFDAVTGKETQRISDSAAFTSYRRANNVYALTYNPNGRDLLEVGRDTTNVILRSTDGAKRAIFSSHTDSVYGVAFNPDGTKFVTASADGTAMISDRTSKTPISTLAGHAYTVRGVAWSNTGTRIATASWDSTAKLWNPETTEEVSTIQHTDFVNSVAFSPNSSQVATGSSDRTIKISNSLDGTLVREIQTPAAVLSLAWNSSGAQLTVGATDKNIYVYDSATGTLLRTLKGHIGAVRAVLWNKDNSAIISGADDGNIKLWDASTGIEVSSLKPASGYAIFTLALSPDGNTIAAGTANGKTLAYTLQ